MMHALWRNSAKRSRTRNAPEGEERRRGAGRHVHLFVDCMYPTCSKKRTRPSSRNKNHHHHHSSSSNPVPVPRVTTYLEPNISAPVKEALALPPPSALPSTEITFTARQQRSTTPLTPLSARQRDEDAREIPTTPSSASVVTVSMEAGTGRSLSQEAPPAGCSSLLLQDISAGDASLAATAGAGLSQYVEGDFTEELSGLELEDMNVNGSGETRPYDDGETYEFANGNGNGALRMDDETRRWTGNEGEDEFVALEAADRRHSFAMSDPDHDNAMFSARAPTTEWIEDSRRHNCNHLLRAQPPLDIRHFAAYV